MPFLIALGVVAFLILVTLLIAYISYRMAFYRGKDKVCDPYCDLDSKHMEPFREKTKRLIDGIKAVPFEKISITSHDGLKLYGRYYEKSENAPLVIQFHGYKSTPYRDFAGGYKIVSDLGLNVIHVEQRSHETSEGKTISFGILEKRDCLAWIDYARTRFGEDVKIVLCGISMGAATVLMASGEILPDNVVGVIADCPYSSPAEIIMKVARVDMHLPARLLYPFLLLGAKLFGGFDLNADTPEAAVKRCKVPILLIHGTSDGFVPHEMSEKIYASAPDKIDFHSFEGAHHGMSYMVDTDRYISVTEDFLRSINVI